MFLIPVPAACLQSIPMRLWEKPHLDAINTELPSPVLDFWPNKPVVSYIYCKVENAFNTPPGQHSVAPSTLNVLGTLLSACTWAGSPSTKPLLWWSVACLTWLGEGGTESEEQSVSLDTGRLKGYQLFSFAMGAAGWAHHRKSILHVTGPGRGRNSESRLCSSWVPMTSALL